MWIECPSCGKTIEAPDEAAPVCPSCGFRGAVDLPGTPPGDAPRIRPPAPATPRPPADGAKAPAAGSSAGPSASLAGDAGDKAWMNCPACRAWIHVPLGGHKADCPQCGARIITPH